MTCPHCKKLIDQAALIRAARGKAGLTQAACAAIIGIDQPHLCALERGRRRYKLDRVNQMLDAIRAAKGKGKP